MYLEYDAIVPTSRNPGANHAKLRDFRVVLFGVYFSSSIPVYPFLFLLFSRKSYSTFTNVCYCMCLSVTKTRQQLNLIFPDYILMTSNLTLNVSKMGFNISLYVKIVTKYCYSNINHVGLIDMITIF